MSANTKVAYFQLHIAVLLFGITAILGKLISIDEAPLVWHRLWISVLGLLFIPGAIRGIKAMSKRDLGRFAGIGCLVILHWVTFYGSIKIGNSASVTLACLSTTTLFTSVLEPLIVRTRFNKMELMLGIFVIIGIWFVAQVGALYYTAIAVGLVSAFLAAFFSVLNKRYIGLHFSPSVTIVELSAGWVFLNYVMLITNRWHFGSMIPTRDDWVYLFILGIFCTSVAFALSLEALKKLSAFVSNLSISLEPVYGILLAVWLLNESEQLNTSFYIGTSILLLAVLIHPFLTRFQSTRAQRLKDASNPSNNLEI